MIAGKSDLNILAVLGYFAFFTAVAIAAWSFPRGQYVLVVTDPRATADDMIDVVGRAGGSLVEGGRYPWIAIAHSSAEGFASRLMRSGAVMVLNHNLAFGCQRGERIWSRF